MAPAVFRLTPTLRFFRNDRSRSFSNPARRWLYHHLIAGAFVFGAGYVVAAYQLAKWEAHRRGDASGRFVCSYGLREFLYLCPFNRLSNLIGQLAEPGPVPPWVHQTCIRFLVWYYEVDLSSSATAEFASLQDFYTRRWAQGARPIASTAVAVAPCDGEVLAVFDHVTSDSLVHVKGLTYSVRSLLRCTPRDVPHGFKRVAVVVHLRMKDYHQVISPASFVCEGCVYVPGELLPTTAAGYHWLPAVLTSNERLVVQGTSAGAAAEPPFLAMALVGSTLTGKMTLDFDRRIRTNFLDPPDYAVHMNYKPSHPLPVGEAVGTFHWGSSVVLMMDVPESTRIRCAVGQSVKAGEALFV